MPATAGIRELFARHVRAQPNAIAVRLGRDRLSYAELDRQANQLAHHLRTQGVRRGTIVGICLDRGPGLAVATLAVVKLAAGYVQIDPHEATSHAAHRLADCRVRTVLTTTRHLRLLPDTGGIICLDLERPLIGRRSSLPPVVRSRPQDPAFIWYGTGYDGVIVPQHTIAGLSESLPLERGDSVLHLSDTASPAAALELWTPLCRGATLVPCPARDPAPRALSALLTHEAISVAFLPPHQLHDLARGPHLGNLSRLRFLLTGGHDLSPAAIRRVLMALPQVRVVHCYAPPACAVPASWRQIRSMPSNGVLPIGQSAGATRLRVLDPRGHRVSPGGMGEIFVAGDGVALGFYNRPAANREWFVGDPYRSHADARMLRTGEFATVLEDGTFALGWPQSARRAA